MFEVDFDGRSLGQGTVAAAIDTGSAGRFADATDKTQYVQSFSFNVPETVFRPDGQVSVRLLNGTDAGESTGARTLYLASVTLNGRAITASGLTTLTDGGTGPNQTVGEFLVIPDGSHQGLSPAPRGGWPQPVAGIADATVPAAATPDPLPTGTIGAPRVGISEEPARLAALDPDPEGGMASCDLDQVYNVIGFNENSNALTPKLTRRLDQVAADIGDRKCHVVVTGYSSKQGIIASSALFAIERAQNSLEYLKTHGVTFAQAIATGAGATDQFGSAYALNRRVVITVTP